MKKPFWDYTEEEEEEEIESLFDQLMSSQSSHGFFRHVKLEGRNVGASMLMRPAASDESPDGLESCRINIYINNNVQGVNNSALVGSQVKMGDPGVCLTFRGVKFNEDSRETNRNRESNEKGLGVKVGFFGKFFFVLFSLLLLLCFR